MEHNWTYIFQELKLVCTQSKEYSFEESTQLIQAASSEIFLPKAKDLGGKIVKNRSAKNLIRFDQLENAELYILSLLCCSSSNSSNLLLPNNSLSR